MKLKKTQLKALVKEMVYESLVELIEDDPKFVTAMIKESLVEMFGDRLLIESKQKLNIPKVKQQTNRQKKRLQRTNVPAMRKQPAQQQNNAAEEPADLFESLAMDTMTMTVGKQLAADSKLKRNMDWENPSNIEEGPLTHLNNARMQPYTHQQHATSAASLQHVVQQHESRAVQPTVPVSSMFAQGIEPSPTALTRAFETQQHRQQVHSVGQQRVTENPLPPVPDDLAALGLGNMQFDVDPAQTLLMSPRSASNIDDMTSIAAEMNSGLNI